MKNGTGDTQNMSQSKVGFFNILFQWKKTPLEWGFWNTSKENVFSFLEFVYYIINQGICFVQICGVFVFPRYASFEEGQFSSFSGYWLFQVIGYFRLFQVCQGTGLNACEEVRGRKAVTLMDCI